MHVPFNRPRTVGSELDGIREAVDNLRLAANGPFTAKCHEWLVERMGVRAAYLTTSCTMALEMAATLLDVAPGDEIIMPSFTFVSTANAFATRHCVPVFVDIRADTLNIDERAIEAAITPKTRAILPVHYAGVGCDMGSIVDIADRHGLAIVEDAAHCIGAAKDGRELGTAGDMATLSFHETKNITCGEGGALLINDESLVGRADHVWEKGTNRKAFALGQVDKYTWVDLGSSYYPNEITAAFLWAQLQAADDTTSDRMATWNAYHEAFEELEQAAALRRPVVPDNCTHNAHAYYLLVEDRETRDRLLGQLNEAGVGAVFHYVPLHSSPAGRQYGRAVGPLAVTEEIAGRLIRLPLWAGMGAARTDFVIGAVRDKLGFAS